MECRNNKLLRSERCKLLEESVQSIGRSGNRPEVICYYPTEMAIRVFGNFIMQMIDLSKKFVEKADAVSAKLEIVPLCEAG